MTYDPLRETRVVGSCGGSRDPTVVVLTANDICTLLRIIKLVTHVRSTTVTDNRRRRRSLLCTTGFKTPRCLCF